MESESKRIIRSWDREIDAEVRHAVARDNGGGPWKAVVWAALWLLWLALLVAVLGYIGSLR